MAKKAPAGAPAWMATFADLMSLLLTLFVLMLTFAEMDIVKYKAIAGSMKSALGVARKDKMAGVIELEGSMRRQAATDVDPTNREEEITAVPSVSMALPVLSEEDVAAKAQAIKEAKADEVAEKIAAAMDDEIKTSGVSVERVGGDVVIRLPSEIAFPSGSNQLNPQFMETLAKLAPTLETTPGEIIIAGHTDSLPIRAGGQFGSNLELSAARATSVAHSLLNEYGMDGSRVAIQGYGPTRPIDSNESADGRLANRRVEISIITPDEVKADDIKDAKDAKDAGDGAAQTKLPSGDQPIAIKPEETKPSGFYE